MAPLFLEFTEKLLEKNGNGYFVGDSLSIADIIWTGMFQKHLDGSVGGIIVPENFLENYPFLYKNHIITSTHPKIAEWKRNHTK